MQKQKLKFPKNFLWGVATSAYQVEGENVNSDWWEWEQKGKTPDVSGEACDYWNRWENDHALLSELGVNIFRLSIEWSRVEPEEGRFSSEAIEHYRKVFEDLKKRNIKTQVTLWWWTSPIWFQKKYGWHKKGSVKVFARYAEKMTKELGDLIDIFTTFNEPMVPLGQGFLGGVYPPGFKNFWKFFCAVNNVAEAHKKAYGIIHKIKPGAPVGISYLYNWYESEGLGNLLKMINLISQWFRVGLLGNKLRGFQDYVGVNYYRLGKIKFNWKNIRMDSKNQTYFGFTIEENKNNVMKWITYPEGMLRVLKDASSRFKLPIYITENGVPTRGGLDDYNRIDFIKNHLEFLHKAIEEGVDVRGYNFWSLVDNLEWLYGYEPKFGLIEMDYEMQKRHPRKSFYEYAKICKSNELDLT